MANNTGLIIGVSVLGVAAVGVTIYLLSKKSSPVTSAQLPSGSSGGFAPSGQRPQTTPPIGYYANPAPANQDSWWQQPLGQVGGNLANKLIDNLFKPKTGAANMDTASTGDAGMDDSASNYGYDTDPNFYGGYGEA